MDGIGKKKKKKKIWAHQKMHSLQLEIEQELRITMVEDMYDTYKYTPEGFFDPSNKTGAVLIVSRSNNICFQSHTVDANHQQRMVETVETHPHDGSI